MLAKRTAEFNKAQAHGGLTLRCAPGSADTIRKQSIRFLERLQQARGFVYQGNGFLIMPANEKIGAVFDLSKTCFGNLGPLTPLALKRQNNERKHKRSTFLSSFGQHGGQTCANDPAQTRYQDQYFSARKNAFEVLQLFFRQQAASFAAFALLASATFVQIGRAHV